MSPHAATYRALGWATIRVHPLAKMPIGSGWESRIDEPGDFAPGDNIGVRLGAPSGGLVDIDLDCPEAIALAPAFLPPTMAFGRAGPTKTPAAVPGLSAGFTRHYLYACGATAPSKAKIEIRGAHVELRSTGGQTVFPGSLWTGASGREPGPHEPIAIEFVQPVAPPTPADADVLRAAWARLSLATLVARAWPGLDGRRHDAAMGLAGALWHAGWPEDDAAAVLEAAMVVAGESDLESRSDDVRSTWGDHGRARTGWPRLGDILGRETANAVEKAAKDPALGFTANAAGGEAPLVQAQTAGGLTIDLSDSMNDAGNAERLITLRGEDLHHVRGLGWLRWDGQRWAEDDDAPWNDLKVIARIIERAGGSGPQGAKLAEFGRQSGNASKIRGALDVASRDPRVRVDVEALDADPWVLGCPNGVVDLHTGELREGRREDLITKCTGVPFDADATCPRFVRFMSEIFDGDAELAAYVLRYLGSALTGLPAQRVFQVWHGEGKNGKSTLIELLLHVLGDYARPLALGLLLESRHQRNSAAASPDLAALRGVRFASCVETDAGQRWNESMVKQLTGGDTVAARRLYQEQISFRPTWTIALATNHKPIVRGSDAAIWDRIHLVPFGVRFEPGEPGLGDALRAEAPGILALLVRTCAWWASSGLNPPASVTAAVAGYRAEQDVLGSFLVECTEAAIGAEVRKSELYRAYKQWAETGGEYVLGKKVVGRMLSERGVRDNGLTNGHAAWIGIKVNNALF